MSRKASSGALDVHDAFAEATTASSERAGSAERRAPAPVPYRLYVLNAHGDIERFLELHCIDDAEAVTRSGLIKHAHGLELWQLGRRVNVWAAPVARAKRRWFSPPDAS